MSCLAPGPILRLKSTVWQRNAYFNSANVGETLGLSVCIGSKASSLACTKLSLEDQTDVWKGSFDESRHLLKQKQRIPVIFYRRLNQANEDGDEIARRTSIVTACSPCCQFVLDASRSPSASGSSRSAPLAKSRPPESVISSEVCRQ